MAVLVSLHFQDWSSMLSDVMVWLVNTEGWALRPAQLCIAFHGHFSTRRPAPWFFILAFETLQGLPSAQLLLPTSPARYLCSSAMASARSGGVHESLGPDCPSETLLHGHVCWHLVPSMCCLCRAHCPLLSFFNS